MSHNGMASIKCKVIRWCVHVTIVTVEVQQCSMCVVDGTCHCQHCNIIECCTEILLWQIHVAGDNRKYKVVQI